MYPEIHPPSQEISDEVFQANHSVQHKENLENSLNSIEEKEGPPQDSNIHQLIEECCVKVCEEQKQSMEDTMLELVKICRQKELLFIHDNVEDLIETATILSTKEPEYSSSMGYEHLSITPETESDEVTESNTENLLPILSECEVTLEDKRDCDVPVSTIDVCDNHSDILSDSKIDDDILVYDDFEDIKYVEASLSNPEIVSVEEENVVQQEKEEDDLEDISRYCSSSGNTTHADNSLPEYDSFCFEIEPDQERLINVLKNNILDDSSNDPLLEEANLFLASDNSIPPGIENFADDSEGDIRFLEELLIDESILSHESSDFNFEDNPSVPRPPPEPPDAETNAGEEIPVVMNDKDKFDEDYYFFMFDKVFSLLSAKSEDTVFDPGISV
uniref:Reverse transcriptase domain-containing protein n=1 Tax=Tanacetum cinerariifolium TaxID=118510 RepID=A0A6L2N104_TANCI|nr:hypothetical protein [Tanacetum cinerariifolium]